VPVVRTRDIETYYELSGQGAPMVLVHGAFVDHRMWDPQVAFFSSRYQVLRYDLRGHGRTGPSARRQYSVQLLADDLKALLEALGITRAVICGLSLGGMVAQTFAATYPDMVERLILADTAASATLTLSDKLQTYLLAPQWMMQAMIRVLGTETFVGLSFKLAVAMRSSAWFGRDPAIAAYVEESMRAVVTAEYLKLYGVLYGFRLQNLAAIACPTLIVNGQDESKSILRHAEIMSSLIPNAKTVTIPQAGHVANMENPEVFNHVLSAFLEGQDAAAPLS